MLAKVQQVVAILYIYPFRSPFDVICSIISTIHSVSSDSLHSSRTSLTVFLSSSLVSLFLGCHMSSIQHIQFCHTLLLIDKYLYLLSTKLQRFLMTIHKNINMLTLHSTAGILGNVCMSVNDNLDTIGQYLRVNTNRSP